MKNAFKGLVIGSLTGAAVGIVIDALYGTSDKSRKASPQVVVEAPVVAGWLTDAAEHGVTRAQPGNGADAADVLRRASGDGS
jgi:hypothetical protein